MSRKTSVILPVHLYGTPAAMPIFDNVPMIEDACQAHGFKWVGGLAACYSFYPTKNLGAYGDGGAIVTDDEGLYRRLRALPNHAHRRIDPLQAAFLRVKLPYLDGWNAARKRNADRYLAGLRGVTLPEPGGVWHQFVIRHPKRGKLRAFLAEAGIETMIHYPEPPHRVAGMAEWYDLPAADELAATVLSLPVGPHLGPEEIDFIIDKVNEFTEHK